MEYCLCSNCLNRDCKVRNKDRIIFVISCDKAIIKELNKMVGQKQLEDFND